jgi:hypothetical protein
LVAAALAVPASPAPPFAPLPELAIPPLRGMPPPPDLASLTADAWESKTLLPRDWLAGTAVCTTSRWMIISDTGVGKTLCAIALGMAIAANRQFLNWKTCGRRRRVMCFDGERPTETFQERVKLANAL